MNKIKLILKNESNLNNKKLMDLLVEEYKIFLLSFNRKDILMEVSDDDKGYIWVKKNINNEFNLKLKDDGWEEWALEFLNNRDSVDKIIGDLNLIDYIQYSYIPMYDFGFGLEEYMLPEAICRAFYELKLVISNYNSIIK